MKLMEFYPFSIASCEALFEAPQETMPKGPLIFNANKPTAWWRQSHLWVRPRAELPMYYDFGRCMGGRSASSLCVYEGICWVWVLLALPLHSCSSNSRSLASLSMATQTKSGTVSNLIDWPRVRYAELLINPASSVAHLYMHSGVVPKCCILRHV